MAKVKLALKLLLLLTFFKGIFWAGVTPAWQAPDEQNHFSLSQFFAESKKISVHPKYDNTISSELLTATDLMNLNWSGSHPMWRPEFSNTSLGFHEKELGQIPKDDRRDFLQKAHGRKNPPLFYLLGAVIYFIFSPFDILVRLFAMRFLSVIMGVLTVLFTFLFVKEIYPKRNLLSLTVASLVSFHPSLSFIGSTFSPDVMAIFITTLFLYLGVKYLKSQVVTFNQGFYLVATSLAGIFTKVTLLPLFVVAIGAVIRKVSREKELTRKTIAALAVFFLGVVLYVALSSSFGFTKDIVVFFREATTTFFIGSFMNYLKIALPHYNGQVFPWYWAIFGWLEISLPIIIYRLLKILTVVALGGLLIILIRRWREKLSINKEITFFFLGVLFFIHGAVLFFDWQTIERTGHLFGLQGRHFLLPLSLHMLLFTVGITAFFKLNFQKIVFFILISFFIFLNLFSLYEMIRYFYPTPDFSTLLLYGSQYKPIFFKSTFLAAYGLIFVILSLLFLFYLVKNFAKEDEL